jgi:hypothetical protein
MTIDSRFYGLVLGSLTSLLAWGSLAPLTLWAFGAWRTVAIDEYQNAIAVFVAVAAVVGLAIDWITYIAIRSKIPLRARTDRSTMTVAVFFVWGKYVVLWGRGRSNNAGE